MTKREGHHGPTLSRKIILGIIESQDYKCALTGRALEPSTAVLDHIIPLSAGGAHSAENLWVIHKDLNKAKGTMTVEQFVQLCREVVAQADDSNQLNCRIG